MKNAAKLNFEFLRKIAQDRAPGYPPVRALHSASLLVLT